MVSNLAEEIQSHLSLNVGQAVKEWRNNLGAEQVKTDSKTLEVYGRSCGGKENFPLAVLFPESSDSIPDIVRTAAKYKVPLYPISCGKNWGYGATVASSSGNVILNLSRLNRIIKVDAEMAYAVVEPGVTQQQLYDYLEQHNIPLTFDVTGSAISSSLIGNLVERGSGPTRYADHFLNSAGMEVILGDGTVLHTGFGHVAGAKSTHLYKWGFGPYLDGLFTQSNFGVVTKVGIWLLPKPRNFTLVIASFDSDSALTNSIDSLRSLKLQGLLPGAIHIANDLRVISVLQNYPFGQAKSNLSLSSEERKALQRKWKVSEWNMLASLEGSKAQVRANLNEIKRILKGKVKIQSFSESFLGWSSKFKLFADLVGQRDLKTKVSILRLMKGVPSNTALRGMYWRKPVVSKDPSLLMEDLCGVLWASPIVPMKRIDLEKFLSVTRTVCDKFNIDTNVSVTLLTERACCCTVGVIFDRANIEETMRAKACYTTLQQEYVSSGYPPYRLNSDLSLVRDFLLNKDDSFLAVSRRIKAALDPDGILAPGKYGI